MSPLRSLSDGLRSLFRKERVEEDLDEELRGFLEMAAEEKIKQGMSRKDALRAVTFGARKPRNCKGSRPHSRLGIPSGGVVARLTLRCSNAPQGSWF